MQIRLHWLIASILLLGPVGPTQAQHAHHHDETPIADGETVGEVHFGAACSARAAEQFDRALALKHHMMYQQARALFHDATREDPDCAMAHWGMAATLFQPLWPERPDEDDMAAGREHLATARAVGTGGDREDALLDAVEAFFGDDVPSYRDRIDAWADAMHRAHQAHPDDLDITALYGLALLAVAMPAEPEQRDALHDEAEALLRDVWQKQPRHPGAIHYSIHATDVDGRARNALEMVEAYTDIAPEVPHALHMPSHIHVRLGNWEQVIDWNRRSADAALALHDEGPVSFHYIHALDYLVYGYLQQGKIDEARAVWEEAAAVDRHQPGFASAFHAAAMPARLAVETRDWQAARSVPVREPDDLPWDSAHWPEGLSWYARGLGAVHKDDLDAAETAMTRLAELRDAARAAGEERFATFIEIDRRILEGWVAHAQREPEQARRLMQAAAELEATLEKDPITPGALYPPQEALGDLLLDLGQPAAAKQAYEHAETIWPGRYNTRAGLDRARQAIAAASAAAD